MRIRSIAATLGDSVPARGRRYGAHYRRYGGQQPGPQAAR